MTSIKRDEAARKRGEPSRDSVARRLSPAIDARAAGLPSDRVLVAAAQATSARAIPATNI
jgi:hypothetical protein